MMNEFTYEPLPMRVVFGAGKVAALPEEADRLDLERVLVLCTPEQTPLAERLAKELGDRCAGIFPHARMHVPIETADQACESAQELRADGCVAVGGGSTVGLGKAIALRHRLPILAVPTTYAGSEMTPIWGLTQDGTKRTGRDRAVLPRTVIYDPELTTTLPVSISVTSAINALAHAAEGLYAPDLTPIIALMARDGAKALLGAIPRIRLDGTDLEARTTAFYGSWLCGAVLGATTMSLHHKLCHVLGGSFNLPHAELHTVMLPHVLSYNELAAPAAADVLRELLDTDAPGAALWDLAGQAGAPTSLRELGMHEHDLAQVVEQVMAAPYANPRQPTAANLLALLTAAQHGRRPSTSTES